MEVPRVLVLGASGMLGRSLVRELGRFPADWVVLGTGNSRAGQQQQLRRLDVLDEGAVEGLLAEFTPAVVVNCVAERDPDAAARDPERTRQLNMRMPERLAKLCAASGTMFVHLSTDYVFDGGVHTGELPPYGVEAPTHPLNFYGETKRDAETVLLAVPGAKALILRVPVLYAADCASLDESASLVVAKTLLSTKPVMADHWGSRFPTLVDDVSIVLRELLAWRLRAPADAPAAILHCSSPVRTTKYELAVMMAHILGVDASHVSADTQPPKGEPRPRDTQLDSSRTWLALGHEHAFTPLGEGMARGLQRFRAQFQAAAAEPSPS
jgi:S-adenosylmethionine synthetase